MKLSQFAKSVSIQGNIEIRKINDDGEALDTLWFDSCEGLRAADLDGWKSLTVKYIYPETFTRRYWTSTRTAACLVIEVEATT